MAADREIRALGVTFTVYDSGVGVDRPWPFDIIPRIIPREQWQVIEAGLVQRLAALNLFIDDCYHDQRAVSSGVVPADLVTGSPNFRRECVGVDPPGGIWAHICGSDLIRDDDGTVYVLEDNLRVPSGVSYLLENRMVAKHVFPELFRHYSIEPVDPYIGRLANMLASVSPSTGDPTIVVLTPGIYNLHTSNTPSWLRSWGWSWSRAVISSGWTMTASMPGPSTVSSGWTWSIGGSTTCSSTPRSSSPTPCSGYPA